MRATLTIAVKDLVQRIRDRSILIVGVVAPLVLAFIFNVVFGGGINDVGQSITLDMGIVDLDEGPVSDAFGEVIAGLESSGLVELDRFESEAAGRQAAENGEVGAVFVLDETLSSDIVAGEDTGVTVIGDVDAPTTTQIATAIAEQFALGVERGNTAAVAALLAGVATPADLEALATEAATTSPALALGTVEAATRQLDGTTYFVAGLSVFFLFFIAGMAVTSMLDERREGTLSRLLAAPISPGSIVSGKSLTSVVIGLVAMTILVVASTFLMGASWGPFLGVAALVVAVVLAVVSIMTMVGGLAHTAEQAGNLQAIVGVTLGMLGGTFVPITGDGLLSQLSLITPNAWFLRGLGDMAGGGSFPDAMPAFGALLLMAVVTGGIGLIIVRKAVRV
jgi:ABC-2 type transport system permease protein